MGGKTKQSQRTKNNVRPSSSGRSAELLSSAMGSVPAFVGLAASPGGADLKPVPALFPTLTETAVNDQCLSADFMLCIKKLNKKDPVTKTKALQELADLVKDSSVEEVSAALPYWTCSYRTLSADAEHRVREATQVTHGVVVGKCGRGVAPHLRQLLPTWLAAQFDPFTLAAAAARAALQNTFPDNKLPEALSFCKAEVMTAISDNLVGSGEAALNKGEDPEATEARRERSLCTGLHSLRCLSALLPAQHHDWLWAELRVLLDRAAFWKLAAHKSSAVRAAWLEAAGPAWGLGGAAFGAQYGPRAERALLAAFAERSPLATHHLHACLLALQDWHVWLENKAELCRKSLELLEQGGCGAARPALALARLLLARLPDDVLTQHFYTDLFHALLSGLGQKSILSSKSERQAWLSGYADCLRDLTARQADACAVDVATAAHRAWLEEVLGGAHGGPAGANLVKHSASEMAALAREWARQAHGPAQSRLDQLVRNFWQNIGSVVLGQVDRLAADRARADACVAGHVLFLHVLKTSQEPKKAVKISFDDDPSAVGLRAPGGADAADASSQKRYDHSLDRLASEVCARYFDLVSTPGVAEAVVPPLVSLLAEFDSRELFVWIASGGRGEDGDGTRGLRQWYEEGPRRWLQADATRCRALVDVALLLLPHLDERDQADVLHTFAQFPPPVVEWCVRAAASHPHRERVAVRRWLRGAGPAAALEAVCERLVREADCGARDLLLACLAHDREGELLISEEAVSGAVGVFAQALADAGAPHLDHSASVASQLVSALAAGPAPPPAALLPLLRAMLLLNLRVESEGGELSRDTWREVRASWQDGLAALPAPGRVRFVRDALHAVCQHAVHDDEKLNVRRIGHAAALCPALLSEFAEGAGAGAGAGAAPDERLAELVSFTGELLRATTTHGRVDTFALRLDCVTGRLCCPLMDCAVARGLADSAKNPRPDELARSDLLLHIKSRLLRALYLRALVAGPAGPACGSERAPDDAWAAVLLQDATVQGLLADLLRELLVLASLRRGYGFWPYRAILEEGHRELDAVLEEIMSAASDAIRRQVYSAVSRKAAECGYYWSLARVHVGRRHLAMAAEEWRRLCEEDGRPVHGGSGFFHDWQAMSEECGDEWQRYRARLACAARSWVQAHARRPLLASRLDGALGDVAAGQLDVFVDCYYADTGTMLYDREVWGATWAEAVSNAALVDALSSLVAARGWDLPAHHWDFVNIALCSLTHSLVLSADRWPATQVCVLGRAVLELFARVQAFVEALPRECQRRQPSEHVAALQTEWRDMFAPDLHVHLLLLALRVLESDVADSSPYATTSNHVVLVSALSRTVRSLRWEAVPAARRAQELSVERVSAVCCAALAAPLHSVFKHLAHVLLHFITAPLHEDDKEKLKVWASSTEDIERPKFSLYYFESTLVQLQELAEAVLLAVAVGEATCELAPASDSHSVALGHLLLCERLLSLAQRAQDDSDLTQQYIQFFCKHKYIETLLRACVRLMPEQLLRDEAAPAQDLARLFVAAPDLDFAKGVVPALACRCLFLGVSGCGAAAARGWWGAAPTRLYRLLQRLVTAYVTPPLVRAQLQEVVARRGRLSDTEVHVHWSTLELECRYSVEERPMELRIRLSDHHPLGVARVSAAGAPAPDLHVQWLAVLLSCHNGSLWRALQLWRARLERRLESAPMCYVCYMHMHPDSGRLPRQRCAQCRNKFHSECLQKWFATSKKMECPLCRAVMT